MPPEPSHLFAGLETPGNKCAHTTTKHRCGMNTQDNLGLSLGLNIFGGSFPDIARVSVWLFCNGDQCTAAKVATWSQETQMQASWQSMGLAIDSTNT